MSLFKHNLFASYLNISSDTVQKEIDRVMKRYQFGSIKNESPIKDELIRLWDFIKNWIKDLFNRTDTDFSLPGSQRLFQSLNVNVLKAVAWVLLAAVLAVILFILIKQIRLNHRKIFTDKDIQIYKKQPRKLLETAEKLAGEQQYTQALQYLFLYFLLNMDEQEIIFVKPWKTNAQYLRELSGSDGKRFDKAPAFASLYNECRYGDGQVSGAVFRSWMDECHQMIGEESK